MSETDSAHAAHPQFTTTHWSMVLAAGATSVPAAQDALPLPHLLVSALSVLSLDAFDPEEPPGLPIRWLISPLTLRTGGFSKQTSCGGPR